MESVPLFTLWLNLIVISGTWGSSFVLVRLITEWIHPFAFAASRGFIAMSALLAWLALRSRTQPAHNERPRRALGKNIRHMVVLGTTNGWLANVLTAIAVSRVDSAVVATLQARVPLMVAVLAKFPFVEEPFRAQRFIGTTGILLAWASHCSGPACVASGFHRHVARLSVSRYFSATPFGPLDQKRHLSLVSAAPR
jgi:drug/metabolite transporter (DMT)-like permease